MTKMSSETMDREATYSVRVSVGNPAFPPGRTEVELDQTGRMVVTSEMEGSDRVQAEAKLDPERAQELIRSATVSMTQAREGKRLGLPDEPRYHVETMIGDRRTSLDVWRSDLKEYPAIDRMITELQQAVSEQVSEEILL
jgi:hypothetical protein